MASGPHPSFFTPARFHAAIAAQLTTQMRSLVLNGVRHFTMFILRFAVRRQRRALTALVTAHRQREWDAQESKRIAFAMAQRDAAQKRRAEAQRIVTRRRVEKARARARSRGKGLRAGMTAQIRGVVCLLSVITQGKREQKLLSARRKIRLLKLISISQTYGCLKRHRC